MRKLTTEIMTDYIKLAYKEALKAFEKDEVPVGAVIVNPKTQEVISQAHNLTRLESTPLAHAEILAIDEACKQLGKTRIPELDMYVTLEPCPMCAYAISMARIRRLYFGAYDPKTGGVEHGPKIFDSSSCHHKPELYGGINENECGELVKSFFKKKR